MSTEVKRSKVTRVFRSMQLKDKEGQPVKCAGSNLKLEKIVSR